MGERCFYIKRLQKFMQTKSYMLAFEEAKGQMIHRGWVIFYPKSSCKLKLTLSYIHIVRLSLSSLFVHPISMCTHSQAYLQFKFLCCDTNVMIKVTYIIHQIKIEGFSEYRKLIEKLLFVQFCLLSFLYTFSTIDHVRSLPLISFLCQDTIYIMY